VFSPDLPIDLVENRFYLRRNFLSQGGALSRCSQAGVLIAEFGTRVLSTWSLCLIRRFRRRPTILWGHVSGRYSQAGFARDRMMAMANGFICYTESQRRWLIARFPHFNVWAAPNSCMAEKDCWTPKLPIEKKSQIVYVGRLVAEKNVDLLIRAFGSCLGQKSFSGDCRLIIVGDGPEAAALRGLAERLRINEQISFLGHISDVSELRSIYSKSFVSVSPGPVGLAAIQSFGFGIPMVIADQSGHGPEIEACSIDLNTIFFSGGNEAALVAALENAAQEKARWHERADSIQRVIREKYTYESMVRTFLAAYGHFAGELSPV
jgi:glycosyltransferase involved in cell wall biosynthesis